ncbi:MAG: DoxX family protein [Polyangiales bacterium]
MNTKIIGYWVTTGLTAALFLYSGSLDLSYSAAVMEGLAHLGYPLYFPAIIGVWKLLGVAAVLAPRFALLKEWAYAGMIFDLSGAAISHAASGDDAGKVLTPIVLMGLVAASWALRPADRRLAAPVEPPMARARHAAAHA